MAKDPNLTASEILKLVGGPNNVLQFTNCMTRLRLKVKDQSKVLVSEIKKAPSVMGLVQAGEEFQIILGPGFVKKVADEFGKLSNATFGGEVDANIAADSNTSNTITPATAAAISQVAFSTPMDGGAIAQDRSLEAIAKSVKAENKAKQTSPIQKFLSKFANIFGPLIIGYIGAGILYGVGSILESVYKVYDAYYGAQAIGNVVGVDWTGKDIVVGVNGWAGGYWTNAAAQSWSTFFMQIFNIWKDIALIMVGWRTTKAFGGSGAYGAIGAAFFMGAGGAFSNGFASTMFVKTTTHMQTFTVETSQGVYTGDFAVQEYSFLGISITDPYNNWLTLGFRPTTPDVKSFDISSGAPVAMTGTYGNLQYAAGNMLGALMIGMLAVPLEKMFRKISPESLDIVLTSTFTIASVVFLNYFLVLPVSGVLFTWIGWLFAQLVSSAVGCALLAGIFLVSVAFGIHQGFVPVYAAVIATTGTNALFPVLAIGGAGQVGMAIALYMRAPRESVLRKQISGAIIPGILGVGEPLIFGVSLPRVKPFITACLGAMVGGLLIGIVNAWWAPWHNEVFVGLSSQFGPSGILAIPLMTNVAFNPDTGMSVISAPWIGMLVYSAGLVAGYAGGFATTYFFGHKGIDLS